MFKKKILFIFLVVLVFIFFTKDFLAKKILIDYLNNKFKAKSSVGSLKVISNGIILKDFSFKVSGGEFKFNDLEIRISNIQLASLLCRVSIFVDGVDIKITDLASLKSRFFYKPANNKKSLFSFSLSEAEVRDFNFNFGDFFLKKAYFKGDKFSGRVFLPIIRIKDKEINDISLNFLVSGGKIILPRAKQLFLGKQVFLQGYVEFKNIQKQEITADLNVSGVALDEVAKIFSDKDDLVIRGIFEGDMVFGLEANKIKTFTVTLESSQSGLINIKNDAPLKFLQRYLNSIDYKLLIEAFKNYTYNRGKIFAVKKGVDLELDMKFESLSLGRRDLVIFSHGVF
jgi:hypothetical protein